MHTFKTELAMYGFSPSFDISPCGDVLNKRSATQSTKAKANHRDGAAKRGGKT